MNIHFLAPLVAFLATFLFGAAFLATFLLGAAVFLAAAFGALLGAAALVAIQKITGKFHNNEYILHSRPSNTNRSYNYNASSETGRQCLTMGHHQLVGRVEDFACQRRQARSPRVSTANVNMVRVLTSLSSNFSHLKYLKSNYNLQ
jgi:K+-transporting ATPase c subunit